MSTNDDSTGLQRFLNIEQAATELGVSTKTVRRLIAAGDLIVYRFGRNIRIARDDFEIYVKLQRAR